MQSHPIKALILIRLLSSESCNYAKTPDFSLGYTNKKLSSLGEALYDKVLDINIKGVEQSTPYFIFHTLTNTAALPSENGFACSNDALMTNFPSLSA